MMSRNRATLAVLALLTSAAVALAGDNGTNTQVRDGKVNVVGPPAPTSYTQYGVVYGNGSSSLQVTTTGDSTNKFLQSGAGSGAPSFVQPAFSNISGALALSQYFACGASQAVRRNAGDSAQECYTPTTGTVTSVGLTMPAEFSVGSSPVTSSGTIAVTKANQSANTLFAGPTSGGAAAPTFRTQVFADLPVIKSVVGFGTGMDVTAGQTVYIWPALTDTTEDRVKAPMIRAQTFNDVACFSSAAPGATKHFVITIGTGACASGLTYTSKATCDISGTGQTCTGSGSTAVTAGECVVARLVTDSGAATAAVQCTMLATIYG